MIKFFLTTGRYPCSRKTERKKNNFIIPFNYSAIAAKETTWYLFTQLLLSVAIIWLFFLFDLFKRILESVNLSWNIFLCCTVLIIHGMTSIGKLWHSNIYISNLVRWGYVYQKRNAVFFFFTYSRWGMWRKLICECRLLLKLQLL